jgi:hypothetical protein
MLDTTGKILGWLCATLATLATLTCLWLARYQPIEMDLAMLHYSAYLINEKHLLLYRDIFENNLPGPFFFHAMIGKAFGYTALPIRFLDAGVIGLLAFLSWKILSPLSKPSAIFAPTIFAVVYFTGGTVATFQRDYIAIIPIAAALALLCNNSIRIKCDAIIIGALCGIACAFKPNFIVVAPAFYWILLTKNQEGIIKSIKYSILPIAAGFLATFSIPLIWGLQHADFKELLVLYKSYTPIYVSTRSDLFHYESKKQQILTLLSMQGNHLLKMALLSIPGLLWAWRQHRENPILLTRLKVIAITTFAMSWHEIIAGKFWFAHLLAPYFFAILCFSLLLTYARNNANILEKLAPILSALFFIGCTLFIGKFTIYNLYNKHYTAENHDIRSKKIARYLLANMQPGDKVQSLDGSGDGQGALLLAQAQTATRFVEDIPLYLQPDSPVTQAFRREFLDDMQKNPPAFFVYIHNFFHPAGGNRLKEFRELYRFLQENYAVGEEEDGQYTIYKYKKKP